MHSKTNVSRDENEIGVGLSLKHVEHILGMAACEN